MTDWIDWKGATGTNFYKPLYDEKEIKEDLNQFLEKNKITTKNFSNLVTDSIKDFKELPAVQKVSDENSIGGDDYFVIVGDLHGDLGSLTRILTETWSNDKIKGYAFLGDYVDRGNNSIGVLSLLLTLKKQFPEKIFIQRGNHEDESIYNSYGFTEELSQFLGENVTNAKHYINQLFGEMPVASVLFNKYLLVHGGIPISDFNLNSIKKTKNVFKENSNDFENEILGQILWNDPTNGDVMESSRGAGYTFNLSTLNAFLEKNNLYVIIRAHETSINSEIQKSFGLKMIHVFSTPYNNMANPYYLITNGEKLILQPLTEDAETYVNGYASNLHTS